MQKRIALLSIALILASSVSACEDITSVDPGTVEIHMYMPDSEVLVDEDTGRHIQLTRVRVNISRPQLVSVATGACNLTYCPPAEDFENIMDLGEGERSRWAFWSTFPNNFPASAQVQASLQSSSATDPAGELPVSIFIEGVAAVRAEGTVVEYQPVLFGFQWETSLQLPAALPADINEAGARFQLIVDPSEWFYDETNQRLVNFEEVVGVANPQSPVAQEVRARMLQSLRLEAF